MPRDHATRQEFHLNAIEASDAESHASLWLQDDRDEMEHTPWGADPLDAVAAKEEQFGVNCFDQPIN